jgi:hypothetical protein
MNKPCDGIGRPAQPWRDSRIAMIVAVLLTLCGCTGMPTLTGTEEVAISTAGARLTMPSVAIDGESRLGPGTAAAGGLEASQACGPIAPFCAIFTVPAGAIVGATAKVTQKLPEDQARDLNRVTADVLQPLSLESALVGALETEARRRGVRISRSNPDKLVHVLSTQLSWDISIGNHVAIRMEISVAVSGGVPKRNRPLEIWSDSAKVSEWIADDGTLIEEALEATFAAVSERIWERLLGPERRAT